MKPSKYIWSDGKMIPWEEANIHIMSHVIHYGSGVFEGIRMYPIKLEDSKGQSDCAIFRLSEHVKRLIESAKIYRMDISYTQAEIEEIILETLRVNELKSGYIRPLIYRGYGSIGLDPRKCPINMAIIAFEWGSYMGEVALEKGISACVSSWSRPAANTFPGLSKACGNYLNSQLIRLEASEKGYEEGIALDVDGFLAEGSGENIFLIKDGLIYTPNSSDSILPGITRSTMMTLAEEAGFSVVEKRIQREFLYLADEIFMCGTAAEVTPVSNVDGYSIGSGDYSGKRGPITKQLQQKYFDAVYGRTNHSKWLRFV